MKRGMISDRRGISVMIGYILLISMAIMMSIIVYQWVKTYIPQGSIECEEGVSLFIQGYSHDCPNGFDLTLKNNGRFDIAGYFIHVTTSPSQELAVTDISQLNINPTKRGTGSVIYPPVLGDLNPIGTGSSFSDSFYIDSLSECPDSGQCIYSVEIIPLRQETIKNRNRAVACTDARVQEPLSCGDVGNPCIIDGDRKPWEDCDGSDLGGKTTCEEAFETGWTGTLACSSSCTFIGCTGPVGQVYGNRIIEGSEQCDDGNSINGDGCSSPGTIDSGWSCTGEPSVCRTVLFQYLFSATNPLDDGWVSSCGVVSCGGTASSEISTVNTPNPCNSADNSCGSYYMITERDWAVYKSIPTTNYKDLVLSYYRRSQDTSGSDRIVVEWRIGNSESWREIERINPTDIWNKNIFSFPADANNQLEIQIRFWLNGPNNHKALWDSINITAARL